MATQFLEEVRMMKVMIVLSAFCFVLYATLAVLFAFKGELMPTIIWSFGALFWIAGGIFNYKTMKS